MTDGTKIDPMAITAKKSENDIFLNLKHEESPKANKYSYDRIMLGTTCNIFVGYIE